MRPTLLGAVCATLVYAAAWRLVPQQVPVELLELRPSLQSSSSPSHESQAPAEKADVSVSAQQIPDAQRLAQPQGSGQAGQGQRAPGLEAPQAGKQGGQRRAAADDLAAVRQQAIDFKKSLPEPVQRALQDVSNLRSTSSPNDLARQVQALDPDRANLEQLRSFAQEFVDVPADQLGEGRFARDRHRALGSRP